MVEVLRTPPGYAWASGTGEFGPRLGGGGVLEGPVLRLHWCPVQWGQFEEGRQNQASFLEIGEDFFGGLPCRGDAESREEISGLSREGFGGIEKVGVSFGSGSGKQEGLDMDGAETRGPFEALQAARDVFGGGKLSATVARQKCRNGHIQKGTCFEGPDLACDMSL